MILKKYFGGKVEFLCLCQGLFVNNLSLNEKKNEIVERDLIDTTTLKSSSSDLLIYFWKSNLLPGER